MSSEMTATIRHIFLSSAGKAGQWSPLPPPLADSFRRRRRYMSSSAVTPPPPPLTPALDAGHRNTPVGSDRRVVEFGLTQAEFRMRRRNFVDKLLGLFNVASSGNSAPLNKPSVLSERAATSPGKKGVGSEATELATRNRHLVVLPSSPRKYMVDKIPYFYRPSTDLRYLTGHTEPNSVLVLEIEQQEGDSAATKKDFEFRSVLFVQDSDVREEKWEGPRIRPLQALEKYGVDAVHCMADLHKYLKASCSDNDKGNKKIVPWCSDDLSSSGSGSSHFQLDKILTEWAAYSAGGSKTRPNLRSPKQALHETRLIKSEAEIELMRKSCEIAASSIRTTMASTLTGWKSEAEAFATVDYHCRMAGASYLAYPPVVAAGDHATVIHYTANSPIPFDRSDLMLMDAGCEYAGYTSDVTRTWPLGPVTSAAQRRVYEAVYDVQASLIGLLKAGHLQGRPLTIDSLYHETQRLFRPHLVDLGLIPNDCDPSTANIVCSELCPHHVSHYLGMDVHDTALVSRNLPLRPGMVITLEPGLYFPRTREVRHANRDGLLKFSGIGVRLEDDILITESQGGSSGFTSCQVLTDACPKSLDEIEAIIR